MVSENTSGSWDWRGLDPANLVKVGRFRDPSDRSNNGLLQSCKLNVECDEMVRGGRGEEGFDSGVIISSRSDIWANSWKQQKKLYKSRAIKPQQWWGAFVGTDIYFSYGVVGLFLFVLLYTITFNTFLSWNYISTLFFYKLVHIYFPVCFLYSIVAML